LPQSNVPRRKAVRDDDRLTDSQGMGAVNVTYRGTTYRVTTEADIVCLLAALQMLQALARRKAA